MLYSSAVLYYIVSVQHIHMKSSHSGVSQEYFRAKFRGNVRKHQ